MRIKTLENILAISMIVGLGTLIGATHLGMKKIALGAMGASTGIAVSSLAVMSYKIKKGNLPYGDEQALNGEYE